MPGDTDDQRRGLMQQAACVAGAWAASGLLPLVAAGEAQHHPRSLLVGEDGAPFSLRRLVPGEPWLFNYPFVAAPVFLLALPGEVRGAELATRDGLRYAAPAGVGPRRAVVAFSAICSHKLMYPTPALSFIGLRKGVGSEPAQVIHCCGDDSRYDPAQGGRVLAGPAPQPLAAVLLDWDAKADRLHAVGLHGGEMFQAFFEKYAFRLEMELGRRARDPSAATALVRPAAAYSRQWQSCRA
ncbi:MAG: Rieske 2Fe-2S domain-containing protein [Piscinibacter sp.]|nr:Rieske 2Fe-2S domain-containing protein [Piscinibacter sp.]